MSKRLEKNYGRYGARHHIGETILKLLVTAVQEPQTAVLFPAITKPKYSIYSLLADVISSSMTSYRTYVAFGNSLRRLFLSKKLSNYGRNSCMEQISMRGKIEEYLLYLCLSFLWSAFLEILFEHWRKRFKKKDDTRYLSPLAWTTLSCLNRV